MRRGGGSWAFAYLEFRLCEHIYCSLISFVLPLRNLLSDRCFFFHTVFLSHFLQVHKTGGQLNEILFEHHAAIALRYILFCLHFSDRDLVGLFE